MSYHHRDLLISQRVSLLLSTTLEEQLRHVQEIQELQPAISFLVVVLELQRAPRDIVLELGCSILQR